MSSNFDPESFGTDIKTAAGARLAIPAADQAKRVAGKLPVVKGRDGRTIFPGGTKIDRTEISKGWLGVWVTFPASVKENSLDRILTYQSSEVMTHYFKESEQLVGVRFYARTQGTTDYKSIEAYIYNWYAAHKAQIEAAQNWYEPNGPGPSPDPDYEAWYAKLRGEGSGATGAQSPAARNVAGQGTESSSGMSTGALAGRIIFTYGGHGRTWDGTSTDTMHPNGQWRWQRGFVNSMNEDLGNVDGCDAFAAYCFNAGATVVPFRPLGYQNNEVIVDNTSAVFGGTWSDSGSTRYYGPGSPPYRFASTANSETATATFTPTIPAAGYYPVYCWANYGSDRVPGQLYRIKSTGGESQVRVDHRRVGCGWVYLGTHYFNAGSNSATGSVIVSNLNPPSVPAGSYVAIADAIRFGDGMGDANNGYGISGYSRREESTVYWIQNGMGHGGDDTIWSNSNTADDENKSWSAPPEMAGQMYRVHSDTTTLDKRYALYLGWHSNAGGGRGSEGLITGSDTTNQAWWAAKVSDEVDAACLEEDANWEFTWFNKAASTYTGGYGEISDGYFGSEMDATIIEVAYHDDASDAALLRDPKVRNVCGRAAYHAAVEYFNNFRGGPLAYLPEPPVRFRALNNGSGGVSLSWQPGPTGGTKGQAATSYRVYQSPDGLGFDGGTVAATNSLTVNGLTAGQTYYFRVAGVNAGGESFPSDTLAVRVKASGSPKILIVNGYDRLDRRNNVDRGLTSASVVEQLILERNNSYNYVRQHGAAIANFGMTFDSCDNDSVRNSDILLTNYQVLVWISGEQSSADNTFNATERTKVTAFLNAGSKNMFVSGAEIGYELAGLAVDTTFYNNVLEAGYAGDDGGSYQATGVAATIFAGMVMDFSPSFTVYNVDFPDKLSAINGSVVAANYTGGGSGGAAIQFSGGSPARKVVNLGFPFECIGSSTTRNSVMTAALTFFGVTESTSGVADWAMY